MTDREPQIRTFHQRFVEHGERSWTTGELLDFQRPASNVIVVAGEGGIGKSTLVRHVVDLAVDGTLGGLPGRRGHAVLDFADAASSSFETVLLRVRAALGPLARSWPAFDVALAVYWERKHPGESLAEFLRRGSTSAVAEQVSGTVDQLLGGFGAVSAAYRALRLVGGTAAQKTRLRRLRDELPALDPILGEEDPDRMLGYMPVLLAADLERARSKRPALALCVLDTLENIQTLPPEQGGLEDLVSRLVYLMPNVMFVGASRLPLRWHDPVRAATLTHGATPPAELFGLGFPELVLRTMRDLSAQDRDLLRAAALLEAFDEEVLGAVLPDVRGRRVETFVRRAFVRRDGSVWPPYRLHENLRRSVAECDAHTGDGWTGAERAANAQRAIDHLTRVAMEIWDERHPLPLAVRSRRAVAAFQLVLRAAHEHRLLPAALGDMAYGLSVLGHWQVLASLPELPRRRS